MGWPQATHRLWSGAVKGVCEGPRVVVPRWERGMLAAAVGSMAVHHCRADWRPSRRPQRTEITRIELYRRLCGSLERAQERALQFVSDPQTREAAVRIVEAKVRVLAEFAMLPIGSVDDAACNPLARIASAVRAALPSVVCKVWRDPRELSAAETEELCLLLDVRQAKAAELLSRVLDEDEPCY
eukprot:2642126-Prymnesium_polylepis.1